MVSKRIRITVFRVFAGALLFTALGLIILGSLAATRQVINPEPTQTEYGSVEDIKWDQVPTKGRECYPSDFNKDGYLQPGTFIWYPVDPELPMLMQDMDGRLTEVKTEVPLKEFEAYFNGHFVVVTAEPSGWIDGFYAHPVVIVQGVEIVLTNASCVYAD